MLEDVVLDDVVIDDIGFDNNIYDETVVTEIIYIAPDIELDFIYSYMSYSLIIMGIISAFLLVLIFIQGWEAKSK